MINDWELERKVIKDVKAIKKVKNDEVNIKFYQRAGGGNLNV